MITSDTPYLRAYLPSEFGWLGDVLSLDGLQVDGVGLSKFLCHHVVSNLFA